MDSITIWTGRPNGINPTTHFWFESVDTGVAHRLCDGAIWIEGQEVGKEPVPFVPCGFCKETYLADVLHGRKLLTISSERTTTSNNGSTPSVNGLIPSIDRATPSENGIFYSENGRVGMLGHRVSVINFTKFCEAMPDRQEALVRQIRAQSLGTKKGGDYYGPLKYLLRRCHWATNDLAIFENGLADLLSRQTKTTKRDNYRRIGEAYIDYWRDRATEYFPVSSADVDIEGLTVSVKPEVGMRTKDGDRQILKLWFNRTSPTRTARRIIGHLLGQVNANPQWLPGIWDIKQRNIPLPVLPPDGFDLALAGQAAAFLRIWDELDQRAAAEI